MQRHWYSGLHCSPAGSCTGSFAAQKKEDGAHSTDWDLLQLSVAGEIPVPILNISLESHHALPDVGIEEIHVPGPGYLLIDLGGAIQIEEDPRDGQQDRSSHQQPASNS